MAYAAATAPEAVAVLVACHLTFCGRCREVVGDLDALAPALAPSADATELPPVEALFDRLSSDVAPSGPPSRRPDDDPLPRPLRERVGGLADLAWRRLPLGVAQAWLELDGAHAFLVDFPAGMTLPDHHHEGVERAMPLVGGFRAEGVSYGPGDLSVAEGDAVHHVQVDEDGRCLCLFVNDGEVLPQSATLRIVGRLLGLS